MIPVEIEIVLVRHLMILGGSFSFASPGKSSKDVSPVSAALENQAWAPGRALRIRGIMVVDISGDLYEGVIYKSGIY